MNIGFGMRALTAVGVMLVAGAALGADTFSGYLCCNMRTDGSWISDINYDENGKTFLFEASDTFKELGRNELKGRVQASPAVDGGNLFVRTDQRLIKVGATPTR